MVIPPAESTGPASRLPIFESVESDWFRRGGRPVSRTTPLPEPDEAGWSSPADVGWQAAEVARAPVFADTTEAGLPKRVPKANLVPGGAGPAVPGAAGARPVRLADQAAPVELPAGNQESPRDRTRG